MSSIEGSVVFVSGAGRGVGRALAVAFAGSGARVAAQDITPINLELTAASIRSTGADVIELVGDTSKKMQVQSMIETARETLGEIDILINSACVAPAVGLLKMDEWDWDRTIGVNLKGYFLLLQSIGRLMIAREMGLMINMIVPPTRFDERRSHPAYEVSMAGICELTRQAALGFGQHDVSVAAVHVERERSPGQYPDEQDAGPLADPDDGEKSWWQESPETVAAAVVDLCSRGWKRLGGEIFRISRGGNLS